jgi:hypothetical protein
MCEWVVGSEWVAASSVRRGRWGRCDDPTGSVDLEMGIRAFEIS